MKALDTLTSFFNMILLSIPIPNQQNQAILLNSTCGNEHFNINGLWDEMQIYLIWSQHVPTESYMSIEYKILVLSTDLHLYRVQRNKKKKKKPNNCVMLLHTIIPILETSILTDTKFYEGRANTVYVHEMKICKDCWLVLDPLWVFNIGTGPYPLFLSFISKMYLECCYYHNDISHPIIHNKSNYFSMFEF